MRSPLRPIRDSTRDVRVQYFLTYGTLGTVLPYASVFFRQAGLTEAQVGYAWAIWSAAVVLSPVLVTWAADAHADPRRLLALASAVSGVALLSLGFVRGVGAVLAVWSVYCLAALPIMPLQDGVHFAQQRRGATGGAPPRPYHLVRVWGTIGFIVPSVLLFASLRRGMTLSAAMTTGAAYAALAAVQALWLADPRPSGEGGGRKSTDGGDAAATRLPTLDAARALLLRPHLLVFTAAILLVSMAGSVHGAFFPIYLTEKANLHESWLGQVSNLAVFIEVFFVFGCGALLRRLGMRRLLALAALASVVRFGLIALVVSVPVALATQAFHGLFLIATGVLPQAVLDEHASDRFRHSMQGLFVMLTGAARVVAGVLSGAAVVAWGLSGLYACAALLCAAAGALTLLAYREPAKATDPPAACPAAGAPAPAEMA